MIRDPSDGSVKTPKAEMTSALPVAPVDEKQIARLERSRAWLTEYQLRSGIGPSTQVE